MKHKVSDLDGALLDAAVEKIEAARFGMTVGPGHRCDQWHKNWAVSGPIIERERITVSPDRFSQGQTDAWDAWGDAGLRSGPTPLIAAMRAYVASKLGEEVELP